MNTARERVQFAIDLTAMSLKDDDVTPVTLPELRYKLGLFLVGPSKQTGHIMCFPKDKPDGWDLDEFRNLQTETRELLNRVVTTKLAEEKAIKGHSSLFIQPRPLSLTLGLSLGIYPMNPGRAFKIINGPTRDIFLMVLVELLTTEDITKGIFTCRREGCGRLFNRVKGQVYCSYQCAQKEVNKDYYQRNKKRLKAKARTRYRKEIKAATGQKVTSRKKK